VKQVHEHWEVCEMTETISTGLPIARSDPFNPADELKHLREERPLTRMEFPDGHLGWLVTSHELVRAVLADSRFSSRSELHHSPLREFTEMRPAAEPGMFIGMDPPRHTDYRKLLTGQFTVRRMNQLSARIEEIVADHLKAMREHGSPIDLVPNFALPIPSLVICELLGVPYDERERFQHDTVAALKLTSSMEEMQAAFMRIQDFVLDLVGRKRKEPGDDMLSGLMANGDLTDEELSNVGVLLLVAGHETTANMLGLGTLALLRNPDQLALLKADPTLIDNTVEELMRYASILQLGAVRTASVDIELAGQVIKAGETLSLSIAGANRDPGKFERPDQLDITRPATGHVGFGHGVHQCLGQQLARIEMRVGFVALFREFPDLRLAVPLEEIRMRTDMAIYGVHNLPVAWSS
jgi:cytochrome P450